MRRVFVVAALAALVFVEMLAPVHGQGGRMRPPLPGGVVTGASSNYGNYLIGYDWELGNFVQDFGQNPMIVGCGNIDCTEPMHFAEYQMYDQSQAGVAASGALNPAYVSELQIREDLYAQYIYFIRICNEWQGDGACGPFVNGDENEGEAIDPATWIAGVRNFVNVIRADPLLKNVKIAFDAPYTDEQAKYYPGDDYVDILTYDMYPGKGQGATSQDAWSWEINGPLGYMNNFANLHGKAMAFPEWCEKFPDGYITTQMANWVNSHNVVAVVFWNQSSGTNGAPGEVNCNIDATSAKLNAFQAAWYRYTYRGSFWPVIIPWQ
jgi:hypothetical protein